MNKLLSKWYCHFMASGMAAAFCISASAQLSNSVPVGTAADNIIPPSPEAAALGRYVQIPVGLYTGTPRIEVPLWQLKEGDITLPMSFSYHASGHLVDQLAPRTGLGWTLNMGGVISRTIMGEADEYGHGGFLQFSQNNSPETMWSGTAEEKYDRYAALMSCQDAQPDQFTFSVNGYTGRFAFNWDGVIVIGSDRKVKIEPLGLEPGAFNFIQGWRLTTDDGTIYQFEARETSQLRITENPQYACNYLAPPVTSWYLTRITSPTGNEVFFHYESYPLQYRIRMSETTNHEDGTVFDFTKMRTEFMRIQGQYLRQITTASGNTTIDFVKGSTPRTDIPGAGNTLYSLAEIVARNGSNQKIKHFRQHYDYSTGRLTLLGIEELPLSNASPSKPPYVFTYSGRLPDFPTNDGPVGFFCQDHWGYYNGATDNTKLTPPYRDFDGANRGPSFAMKAGILVKIKYPTGGTTTFEYEPHYYSYVNSEALKARIYIEKEFEVHHSGQNSGDTYESRRSRTYFTIGEGADMPVFVRLIGSSSYCSSLGIGGGSMGPQSSLKTADGETIIYFAHRSTESSYTHQIDSLRLPPGTYYLEAFASNRPCENGGWDSSGATISWSDPTPFFERPSYMAGGLRIQKITEHDGIDAANDIVREFNYTMIDDEFDSVVVSSGVIGALPRYEFPVMINDPAAGDAILAPLSYISRIATSVVSLVTTSGSPVGYRKVTVLYGEEGTGGKTESYFTSFYEESDQISESLPFAPPSTYDYRRGLLTRQIDYKKEGNTFVPVRRIDNTYNFSDQNIESTSIPGYKVGLAISGGGPFGAGFLDRFSMQGYVFNLGISKPVKSVETLFENGTSFVTEQCYEYDPALQFVKKNAIKTSSGKEIVTEYSYPFDYFSAPYVFDLLKARHMFPVVEKIVKDRTPNGVDEVIGASFTQFSVMADNKILPSQQLKFSATSPVVSFTPSTMGGGWPDYQYYTPAVSFERYTVNGLPQQMTTPGDVTNSYIWGYENSLPMAAISNAPFAHTAFTNFESSAQGNWIYDDQPGVYWVGEAKTGNRSSIAPLIQFDQLGAGEYVVSLWAKSLYGNSITVNGVTQQTDGEWRRYEFIVSGPGPVHIENWNTANAIDDVRLHPVGALMKTFTYEPGIGMTSATDENHQTTHYEFDQYGRLRNVKDKEKNIRTNYQYRYKQ